MVTEAGRRLAAYLDDAARRSWDTSFPNSDDDIAAIEAEAREAALAEAEEAVQNVASDPGAAYLVNRYEVLDAIRSLGQVERRGR